VRYRAVLFLWVTSFLFSSCSLESPAPAAEVAIFANPLQANTSAENYFLPKAGYQVAYRDSWKRARAVSWSLTAADLGSAERQNQFRPDDSLPTGWYQVRTNDYTGSGFDRGHLCPSADRTLNAEVNQETFLMTNIVPQSPVLNRGAWANLELFARDLARAGYVVHQWVGVYGAGGEGSLGVRQTIGPNIQVPGRMFKAIWAIPRGETLDSDRAISLLADFPNADSRMQGHDWVRFLTSWEELTKRWNDGNLQSGVEASVWAHWRGDWWDYRQSPVEVRTPCQLTQGRLLYVGPEGGCFYRGDGGRKVYVDASRCRCETSL
jgi:endonuclease G, mitochondrial